jgi:hypothetical protein
MINSGGNSRSANACCNMSFTSVFSLILGEACRIVQPVRKIPISISGEKPV